MKALKLSTTILANPADHAQIQPKALAEHLSIVARGWLRAHGIFTPGNQVIVEIENEEGR